MILKLDVLAQRIVVAAVLAAAAVLIPAGSGAGPAWAQSAADPPAAADQGPDAEPEGEADKGSGTEPGSDPGQEPGAPAAATPPVQPLSDEPSGPARAGEPETLTATDFYQQIVGLPLCGTPPSGPLQGRPLCTVHLNDGTVVVAGPGILLRGIWEIDENEQVCRRSLDDPMARRRCVTYQRVAEGRYRNSDGIDVCVGPCGP